MLSLLLFVLWINAIYAQSWQDLPTDLITHEIFPSLSIKAKLKSVAALNTDGQLHFNMYHREEIELYKQLIAEIESPNEESYGKMQSLATDLRFSEVYSAMLPTLLSAISKHPYNEVGLILRAIGLRPISLNGFNLRRSNVSNPHLLAMNVLTFASRTLLQYYIPEIPVPIAPVVFLQRITTPGKHKGEVSWFNLQYPWVVNYFDDGLKFHQYWAIYMSYLYEVVYDLGYKTANIPSLNCVYKHHRLCDRNDFEKRRNLAKMIENGLIVWSRDNIIELRTKFFKEYRKTYPFYHYILEAHRVNKVLFEKQDPPRPFMYGVEFMSKFIADVGSKYGVKLKINTSNIMEVKAMTSASYVIEAYRYEIFRKGYYQLFEDLTQLMIRMGDMNDNNLLIIGCMSQTPVNRKYMNQTIQMVYAHNPDIRGFNIREFLIRIIIARSKSHYFALGNKENALSEIRKLAKDPLFAADTLSALSQEPDEEYATTMISELYKQRKDWSFKAALTASRSPATYSALMNMMAPLD